MGGERPAKANVIEVSDDKAPAKESGKDKDREKGPSKDKKAGAGDADKAAPVAPSKLKPPPAAAKAVAARPAAGRGEAQGLSDEAMTQIGKEKFEVQEEKLKDVARHSMSLLRDFAKMPEADRGKRVAEIRKTLMKYEMQCVRSWEQQEKRRRLEIAELEAEAARCRRQAEEEGVRIVELRQVLDQERRRRKRYEGYEELATEVNCKKTRPDLRAEVESTTADIARLQQQRAELQSLTEQRNQRAQLLRHAVLELKMDLQKEQDMTSSVLQGASAEQEGDAAAGEVVEVVA